MERILQNPEEKDVFMAPAITESFGTGSIGNCVNCKDENYHFYLVLVHVLIMLIKLFFFFFFFSFLTLLYNIYIYRLCGLVYNRTVTTCANNLDFLAKVYPCKPPNS